MVTISSRLAPVLTRTDLLIFTQILYYYVVIWLLSAYGGVSYACQEKAVPPLSTRPFTAVYRLMIRFSLQESAPPPQLRVGDRHCSCQTHPINYRCSNLYLIARAFVCYDQKFSKFACSSPALPSRLECVQRSKEAVLHAAQHQHGTSLDMQHRTNDE